MQRRHVVHADQDPCVPGVRRAQPDIPVASRRPPRMPGSTTSPPRPSTSRRRPAAEEEFGDLDSLVPGRFQGLRLAAYSATPASCPRTPVRPRGPAAPGVRHRQDPHVQVPGRPVTRTPPALSSWLAEGGCTTGQNPDGSRHRSIRRRRGDDRRKFLPRTGRPVLPGKFQKVALGEFRRRGMTWPAYRDRSAWPAGGSATGQGIGLAATRAPGWRRRRGPAARRRRRRPLARTTSRLARPRARA